MRRFERAQIATQLGIGLNTAWRDVQDALAETNTLSAERAEELRAIEVERLDATRNRVRAGPEWSALFRRRWSCHGPAQPRSPPAHGMTYV